jgi:ABC-type amino acid transport substrate-binding protein
MPITPSDDIQQDITAVKALLKEHAVLGIASTCTDPSLYHFETNTKTLLFSGMLNELVPAIMNNEAETTLLDVPDALIALQKWPGKIKVIGPVSALQEMGCGFAKSSPELREAFNRFFEQCQQDGTYLRLVKKYYPTVFSYYPEFFEGIR